MPKTRDDMSDLRVAYRATRELIRARDADAARGIVADMCRELGATMAPAEQDPEGSLPIDLALGEGEPILPVTDDADTRSVLITYLGPAVADARLVVERHFSASRMVHSATTDPLTGLWNRRALTTAINRARPGDCICLLDLDFFKTVNDTLGHDFGDEVLKAFAGHLKEGVRKDDVVGRLGGEEFVILFPATARQVARELVEHLRATWPAAAPYDITFSAGIAEVHDTDEPPDVAGHFALAAADSLMYRAKEFGRDRVEVAA